MLEQETTWPAISFAGAAQLLSKSSESTRAILFNGNPYLSLRGV